MFVQEVSIEINVPRINRAELVDEMEWFISALTKNGQAQDVFGSVYFRENRLVWLTCSLEKSSLSPKNDNLYVKEIRSKLEKMCLSKFKVETRGKESTQDKQLCRCKKPSSYFLFTNFLSVLSPIYCGDCGGLVPLYRIPKETEYGESEHFSVGSWEAAYKACDELQMQCGFGEAWGTKQMRDHDSGLAKQGREICRELENVFGVPVYYYLYNSRHISEERDKQRKCPECGDNWLLEEPWYPLFDFRCEKCRLVSNITFNPR